MHPIFETVVNKKIRIGIAKYAVNFEVNETIQLV